MWIDINVFFFLFKNQRLSVYWTIHWFSSQKFPQKQQLSSVQDVSNFWQHLESVTFIHPSPLVRFCTRSWKSRQWDDLVVILPSTALHLPESVSCDALSVHHNSWRVNNPDIEKQCMWTPELPRYETSSRMFRPRVETTDTAEQQARRKKPLCTHFIKYAFGFPSSVEEQSDGSSGNRHGGNTA